MNPTEHDANLLDSLRHLGLLRAGETARLHALAGGVSSDILRVEIGDRVFCVKRALAKLKVKAEWRAPVERNHWEVEWMRVCAHIEPKAVPAVLGEDRERGVFVMQYMDELRFPLWKAQLAQGTIDPAVARQVGERIVHIHASTARAEEMRKRFATDPIFIPIRIEPYLLATAHAHPDLADTLTALAHATAHTKLALVHGDVSPKNILVGPEGPVFLDAECAWYGDPAFDLAFCLNHLLLKCLWHPRWTDRYLDCFHAMTHAYLEGVDWEPTPALQARAARLLPGLFLARVDGKSPAEYITQVWQRDKVRAVARQLLRHPLDELRPLANLWREAMADRIGKDE